MKNRPAPARIVHRDDLIEFARNTGVRPDWHGPDGQGVDARVYGNTFDNTGFWPLHSVHSSATDEDSPVLEKYLELTVDGMPVAHVNLATLLAWATGDVNA